MLDLRLRAPAQWAGRSIHLPEAPVPRLQSPASVPVPSGLCPHGTSRAARSLEPPLVCCTTRGHLSLPTSKMGIWVM